MSSHCRLSFGWWDANPAVQPGAAEVTYVGVACQVVHDLHLTLHICDVICCVELALGDRLACQHLSSLLVSGQSSGAKLALAQHLAKVVPVRQQSRCQAHYQESDTAQVHKHLHDAQLQCWCLDLSRALSLTVSLHLQFASPAHSQL